MLTSLSSWAQKAADVMKSTGTVIQDKLDETHITEKITTAIGTIKRSITTTVNDEGPYVPDYAYINQMKTQNFGANSASHNDVPVTYDDNSSNDMANILGPDFDQPSPPNAPIPIFFGDDPFGEMHDQSPQPPPQYNPSPPSPQYNPYASPLTPHSPQYNDDPVHEMYYLPPSSPNQYNDDDAFFGDRRTRFVSDENPFDWIKPKSDFKTSNFLLEYNNFDINDLSDNSVRNCLPYNIKQQFDEFPNNYLIEHKCVRLWTLESKIYHEITNALYTDNKYEIQKYLPLIRGLNKFLVSPTKYEMITYRGSHMSSNQFSHYKKGNEYRAPVFGATTGDSDVAESFIDQIKITFIIPKNCWNAACIDEYSIYPNEKEVLLPAYSDFKVLDKSYNSLKVQVLDNKAASEHLSSIFI